MITLTDAAISALHKLLGEESGKEEAEEQNLGLKLGVDRGGCAGLQYAMRVGAPQEGDYVYEQAGVRVFIDRDSIPYVRGSAVDYQESLSDSGFKITNPNAARSCGCGTSFEAAQGGVASEGSSEMDLLDDCTNSGKLDEKDIKI